eukprot:COSAG01_NODE_3307_length_6288_cov_62.023913_7_plen_95_part_00
MAVDRCDCDASARRILLLRLPAQLGGLLWHGCWAAGLLGPRLPGCAALCACCLPAAGAALLACFALLALPSLPLVASATSTLLLRSDAEKDGWE